MISRIREWCATVNAFVANPPTRWLSTEQPTSNSKKNRKQACWIRVLVVGWWSTVGARGWSTWGYHLWRVNSSIRFWERNMIFPVRAMRKLKINQPVVRRSCTSQIRYSHSYKNSTPCGQTAGGDRAPRLYLYMCAYTYTYILTYIYTYIYIYAYTHIYIITYTYTYT